MRLQRLWRHNRSPRRLVRLYEPCSARKLLPPAGSPISNFSLSGHQRYVISHILPGRSRGLIWFSRRAYATMTRSTLNRVFNGNSSSPNSQESTWRNQFGRTSSRYLQKTSKLMLIRSAPLLLRERTAKHFAAVNRPSLRLTLQTPLSGSRSSKRS